MIGLKQKLPEFLLGKFQLMATLVFATLFAILVLIVSLPYSNNVWFELGGGRGFLLTVLFTVIALCIAIISKVLMHAMRNKGMLVWHYILWNITEVLAICGFYILVTSVGDAYGIIDRHGAPFGKLFLSSLRYGFASIGIPYVIAALYFDILDKENTIRMINYGNVVTDQPTIPEESNKIALFDNNGTLRLSLNVDSLYYFESDDNYIKVWYTDETDTLKQYMLRCRLRTVEENFSDNGLLRCHRKYIVNLTKVRSIKKAGDTYQIDLGREGISPLPISKTYEKSMLSAYNSRPDIDN